MLKDELIRAITLLRKNSTDKAKIDRLLKTLNSKIIEDTHLNQWKVFNLLLLIYLRWPEIRKDPNNHLFKKLGKKCLKTTKIIRRIIAETKSQKRISNEF